MGYSAMKSIPNRYNLENAKRLFSNPSLLLGEVNRIGLKFNKKIHNSSPPDGVRVMDEDWDNLLILDACRYDAFKSINWIDGDLSKRISLGSCSGEFIKRNFSTSYFHDTIYITSNPHVFEVSQDTFFKVVPLFQERWDDNLRTVLPEEVSHATKMIRREYPNKRLIVHFMQPHTPFIGDLREDIPHKEDIRQRESMLRSPHDQRDIWTNLRYGLTSVSTDLVKEAYEQNLKIVLEEVDSLLDDLDGKSVITSDHGEMFGERLTPIPVRGFGHPDSIYTSELIEVPWLRIKSEDRRLLREDPPLESNPNEDIIEDRLAALGYQ